MIEIEKFQRESTPGKSTIAVFTVHTPGAPQITRFRKCKLLKMKNGHYKVVLPSYSTVPFSDRNPNDPVIYEEYTEPNPNYFKNMEKEVLEALTLQEFISAGSSNR